MSSPTTASSGSSRLPPCSPITPSSRTWCSPPVESGSWPPSPPAPPRWNWMASPGCWNRSGCSSTRTRGPGPSPTARNSGWGTLSHGEKQWREVAMLRLQEPTLLLLDEPVAGMTRAEKEKTVALMESIVQRSTCTIMLIEHDMQFVRQIAGRGHRVTVLHEGSVLSEGSIDRVQSDERVIEAYLGRGTVSAEAPC